MLKFLFSRIPEDKTRPNILLIDDDRDIRTVTSLVLITSGLGGVREATCGREGLEMARQGRPDVILLDMKLPDIGGETVLQLLKADPWTRDVPVVLFTANAKHEHLRSLPVADVVLKPFHPPQLCEVIRRALGRNAHAGLPRKPPHTAPAFERIRSAVPAAGLQL